MKKVYITAYSHEVAQQLDANNWDTDGITDIIYEHFPNAEKVRITYACIYYVYIDVDGTKYRISVEGDVEEDV